MTPTFDAIVIGSGAGGAAAAFKLANAGLRVAVLEKGRDLPRDASTLDFNAVVHEGRFRSREAWRDRSGNRLVPEEYFNVGGKTKWYGAALLRYSHREFEADTSHGCLGWPIGYNDLARHYDEAERLLGVRTFDTEPDLHRLLARMQHRSPAWRSEPLPMALSPAILRDRIEATRFDGFASVAGFKSDSENAFLARIRGRPNVTLLTDACATDLIGDSDEPRRVIGVRLQDGRILLGHAVLLAAGALHSPRLLSRYLESSGIGTTLPAADNVGRNLKLHLLTAVVAVSPSRQTDLLRKTTLLLNDSLPHSSVQPLGFDGELISTLIPRLVPRAIARAVGNRAYGFFLQTEDGSHPDNRVIDGTQPVLDYDAARTPTAAHEHSRLLADFRSALLKAGLLVFSQRIGLAGTAHACGTLVAGADQERSVVDATGRVHGMEALYVVDGSVLPRSSRVNPSLTIYSWSLRTADALAMRLARKRERTGTTQSVMP